MGWGWGVVGVGVDGGGGGGGNGARLTRSTGVWGGELGTVGRNKHTLQYTNTLWFQQK